ncbi:hypothetical protein Tco_0090162 [Tanacetum coccineum]
MADSGPLVQMPSVELRLFASWRGNSLPLQPWRTHGYSLQCLCFLMIFKLEIEKSLVSDGNWLNERERGGISFRGGTMIHVAKEEMYNFLPNAASTWELTIRRVPIDGLAEFSQVDLTGRRNVDLSSYFATMISGMEHMKPPESIQTALYAHGDEVEALHSQFLMSQYPELTNADRAGVVDRDSEQKIHDFVTIKIERSDSLLADCTKEHYFHIKKCNQLRQKEVKIRTLKNHEEKETQRRRRKVEDPLLKDDKLEPYQIQAYSNCRRTLKRRKRISTQLLE